MTITSERVEELREVAYQNPEGVYGEASNAELSALLGVYAERDALVEGVRELVTELDRAVQGATKLAGTDTRGRGQLNAAARAQAHSFGLVRDRLTKLLPK